VSENMTKEKEVLSKK